MCAGGAGWRRIATAFRWAHASRDNAGDGIPGGGGVERHRLCIRRSSLDTGGGKHALGPREEDVTGGSAVSGERPSTENTPALQEDLL